MVTQSNVSSESSFVNYSYLFSVWKYRKLRQFAITFLWCSEGIDNLFLIQTFLQIFLMQSCNPANEEHKNIYRIQNKLMTSFFKQTRTSHNCDNSFFHTFLCYQLQQHALAYILIHQYDRLTSVFCYSFYKHSTKRWPLAQFNNIHIVIQLSSSNNLKSCPDIFVPY